MYKRQVYSIPYTCGQVYICTTKRSVRTHLSEHRRYCRLGQPEKSAVAEHALSHDDHRVMFDEARVLSSVRGYFTRLHLESIHIHKNVSVAMNRRGESNSLNSVWHGLFSTANQNGG